MANQITITSGTGNIQITTSRSVIGTVANVASANIAYALDADIANVSISGGTNGYFLQTDGAGNLTWAVGSGGGGNVGGSNTQIQYNDGGNFNGSSSLTFNNTTNLTTISNANIGLVHSNVIPNANITYNLGNNTNRFKDLYLANSTIYLGSQTINANATNTLISGVITGNGAGLSGIVGANISGAIANADYANFSGNAYSVDGANVSGSVANATYANIAGSADSVAGANVSGTVANANFAANANVANTAFNVSVSNVSGIGNIATVNLDGNASNVLRGDGSFAPEASNLNANYANFAGDVINASQSNITSLGTLTGLNVNGNITAANISANTGIFTGNGVGLSQLAGANVTGTVANANFSAYSNIANSANSVAGANVSGEVANANYASYANIANTANSVAVANVSGIGNIATVNLNGNGNQALLGNGTFGTPLLVGDGGNISNIQAGNITGTVANANYAAYAGEVVDASQPNITSVGNLVSLTINNNVANTPTYQFNGNGINVANINVNSVLNIYPGNVSQTQQAVVIKNYSANNVASNVATYAESGSNVQAMGYLRVVAQNIASTSNLYIPASYQTTVFQTTADLSNANTSTFTRFTVGTTPDTPAGFSFLQNAPFNQPTIRVFNYGSNANLADQSSIQFTRRRGNGDSRSNVAAGDSLGNIEWRAADLNASGVLGTNTRPLRIAPYVGSTYTGANNEKVPQGLQIQTVNSSNNYTTHDFYANGNVGFGGIITSTGNSLVIGALGTTNSQINIANAHLNLSVSSNTFNIQPLKINWGGNVDINNDQVSLLADGNIRANGGILVGNGNISMSGSTGQISTKSLQIYTAPGPANLTINANGLIQSESSILLAANTSIFANGDAKFGNSNVNIYANGLITTTGNVNAENINISSGDVFLYANGDISATGRLSYLRTYGDFYSNATQTNPVANTVNLMTLNNTGTANGISIVSNSQITIARTGIYNIQFSAQLEHDVNQTANVEIWLKKNGNNVADTNTIVTVSKDQKTVAAWNWLANANTANDYFEIAWASSDTNIELVKVDAANTIANVNIPSVILTVTPVGA